MADTYRAVEGAALGDPSGYAIVTRARAALRDRQVRLRIAAAGVSFVDVLIAGGRYQVKPATPYVPGLECSGVVIECAPDVAGIAIGDRVAALAGMGGGFGEEIVVAASAVIPLPDGIDLAAAATAFVNYQTAWHALVQRARLSAGETVLVLGGAGGVGAATIEVARALGARVIAAASSEAKREYCRSLGADIAIDAPGTPDWRAAVTAATDGRGADVIVDPVGAGATEAAFRSLAWNGRLLVIGFAGGDIARLPTNLPLLKGAALVGVDLRQFREREPDVASDNLAAIDAALRDGRLTPRIDHAFPLDHFATAMRTAIDRDHVGRVAIVMPAPSQG